MISIAARTRFILRTLFGLKIGKVSFVDDVVSIYYDELLFMFLLVVEFGYELGVIAKC
jgi:hypothetical protein